MYQALAFDAALTEEGFGIRGTSEDFDVLKTGNLLITEEGDKWNGISEVILGTKEWFEAWVEGERKCEFCEFWVSVCADTFQLLMTSITKLLGRLMLGSSRTMTTRKKDLWIEI